MPPPPPQPKRNLARSRGLRLNTPVAAGFTPKPQARDPSQCDVSDYAPTRRKSESPEGRIRRGGAGARHRCTRSRRARGTAGAPAPAMIPDGGKEVKGEIIINGEESSAPAVRRPALRGRPVGRRLCSRRAPSRLTMHVPLPSDRWAESQAPPSPRRPGHDGRSRLRSFNPKQSLPDGEDSSTCMALQSPLHGQLPHCTHFSLICW
jgi:hypothetical protein